MNELALFSLALPFLVLCKPARVPREALPLPVSAVGECVSKALVMIGMPPKEAYALMGMDKSAFSTGLHLHGFKLDRLMLLDALREFDATGRDRAGRPRFLAFFLPLLADSQGVELAAVGGTTESRLARVERELQSLRARVPA